MLDTENNNNNNNIETDNAVIKDNDNDNETHKKICFVTSIFGNDFKNCDSPGLFSRNANFDYLLLTNFDSKLFNTSWDVITIQFKEEKEKFRFYNVNARSRGYNIVRSRYPKFMLWKIFQDYPEVFSNNVRKKHYSIDSYDTIIYCDAFLSPRIDVDWLAVRSKLLISNKEEVIQNYIDKKINKSDKKIITKWRTKGIIRVLQDLHDMEVIQKGGIKEDCKMIVLARKDTLENVLGTLQLFSRIMGQDSGLLKQGRYCLNTCLAYNMRCPDTLAFLESFWKFYNLNSKQVLRFTYRDQPIWNFWLIYQKQFSMADNGNSTDTRLDSLLDKFAFTGKFRGHNISSYS